MKKKFTLALIIFCVMWFDVMSVLIHITSFALFLFAACPTFTTHYILDHFHFSLHWFEQVGKLVKPAAMTPPTNADRKTK
jgi:hypothetical protein